MREKFFAIGIMVFVVPTWAALRETQSEGVQTEIEQIKNQKLEEAAEIQLSTESQVLIEDPAPNESAVQNADETAKSESAPAREPVFRSPGGSIPR
ncbi:MAG: hypothetical protein AB7F86_09920 [Bdellovibrionales bacterium]